MAYISWQLKALDVQTLRTIRIYKTERENYKVSHATEKNRNEVSTLALRLSKWSKASYIKAAGDALPIVNIEAAPEEELTAH
jgi:hypothetical protein